MDVINQNILESNLALLGGILPQVATPVPKMEDSDGMIPNTQEVVNYIMYGVIEGADTPNQAYGLALLNVPLEDGERYPTREEVANHMEKRIHELVAKLHIDGPLMVSEYDDLQYHQEVMTQFSVK